MSPQLLEVAFWEFRRWYKLKEQFLVLAFGLLGALLLWFVRGFFDDANAPVHLATVNAEVLGLESVGRFVFEPYEGDVDELVAAPVTEDRAGALVLDDTRGARLHCEEVEDWAHELEAVLEEARMRTVLGRVQLSETQRTELFTPVSLELLTTDPDGGGRNKAGVYSALAVIGLTILGVFVGMTYQFVAITGEKQARVTELVLSAVTPQTWMDGKIAGLSLLSIGCVFTYTVSGLVFMATARFLGTPIPLSLDFAFTLDLLWVVALGLGGFLLWNTAFAAIAATVDDPYSSARGSLLMLPLISAGLGVFALVQPDEPWTRVCALLPPTSWTVLPARLVLEDPPLWEVLLSLTLLLGTVYLLRIAAGRIFRRAILRYGKEPAWREMWGWSRTG